MPGVTGNEFAVEVQLTSEPCLWRWEIASDSSEEAYRAGTQRLSSLVGL